MGIHYAYIFCLNRDLHDYGSIMMEEYVSFIMVIILSNESRFKKNHPLHHNRPRFDLWSICIKITGGIYIKRPGIFFKGTSFHSEA